ncbi:MAG: amidohydrolase family protein, partial [Lachnospiraceae bacterium]
VSGVDSLLKELTAMVRELGFGLEEALPYVTSHVAEALGLGGVKGYVREGQDADLLLLTPQMELRGVIARGAVMMEEGELKQWGTYEKPGH